MYGFDSAYKELNIENVTKLVPDSVLWRHYLGFPFELDKAFSAPYRKDNDPSFAITEGNGGRLFYKDFGRPNVYGDIFNYLQLTLGLSFKDSLRKINTDFNLKLGVSSDQTFGKRIKPKELEDLYKFEKTFVKKTTPISYAIQCREWRDSDYVYWSQYGITAAILNLYNVYCVNRIDQNGSHKYTHTDDNPCYVYWFPKSKHCKFYFPLAKTARFLGNVNNLQDIQGYYQCDVKASDTPSRTLVLTKSMKDCMVFRLFGIDAMAINGENHQFQDDFIRHIKKYYTNIISLYDPDKAGILGAKALWKKHKIKPFFLQRMLRSDTCKDVSDLYKEYGEHVVRRFIEGYLGLKPKTITI